MMVAPNPTPPERKSLIELIEEQRALGNESFIVDDPLTEEVKRAFATTNERLHRMETGLIFLGIGLAFIALMTGLAWSSVENVLDGLATTPPAAEVE